MNNLYYQTHPFKNEINAGFRFDEETVKAAIRRIYEKNFNPLTEIDEGVFNETWSLFNRATDEGFGIPDYGDPDYEFYQQIRHNNAVFSAFRTHRLQNDIAAQLLDENGKLKPFEQFSNDVQMITDHNVKQWLRTEYDTAILRAHQAADWVQFGKVKDILPNLRWLPTTSITPDAVHKRYWEAELTLPQEHPFWTKHRPGDRWNCKCSLEATDDPVKGKHVIDDEDQPVPDRGLDINPGESGQLFSDTHPYIPAGCSSCRLPGKKILSNNPNNILTKFFNAKGRKDCYHCSRPLELIKKAVATKEEKRRAKTTAFKNAKNNAIEKVKKHVNKSIPATNLQSSNFWDSKWGLKAIINHSISNDEIKAAMALPKNIDKLTFIRVSPLGEGKDLSNPVDIHNLREKRKRGIIQFNIYEYSYKGKVYYVKLAQNRRHGGYEETYTFTKKP